MKKAVFAGIILFGLNVFASQEGGSQCDLNVAAVLSNMSNDSGQSIVNILEQKGYQPVTDNEARSTLVLVNQSTFSRLKQSFLGDSYYVTVQPNFAIIEGNDLIHQAAAENGKVNEVIKPDPVAQSSDVGTYNWIRSGDQSAVNKAIEKAKQKILQAIESLPQCPE